MSKREHEHRQSSDKRYEHEWIGKWLYDRGGQRSEGRAEPEAIPELNVPRKGGRIVAFFEGNGPDDCGRLLAEILAWDDDALERVHDFI